MRLYLYMALLLITFYCSAEEIYLTTKVTLNSEIGDIVNLDGFYTAKNDRKMTTARIKGRESNFPVMFVEKTKTDLGTTYTFDMPSGIKEAKVGGTADVVLALKPEYMSISCTAVVNNRSVHGSSVVLLDKGNLLLRPVAIVSRLSNNKCIAKSLVGDNSCVVDKPDRFRMENGEYSIPAGNNCGNDGLSHKYIMLNGIIDVAK
ncbi:MAG: hypothetical protein KME65_13825 [Candidatus Thiodiazotropha sp. (ex Ctena orbiculata)]|uniref:Uncharacterized protein n=1 Tax=Candidatus Thiodiazotropha taylori TaxID=2792791 RepID=A0A944MA19_9GAMM|nr:hypothetical protein [Candidatus Thiodiazotropha taylori]MBV2138150.1 hypothetical protein [Candidatus Thiodiazotropha taylori]PUB84928.1 MAG: hypothetical protein DBP00_13925 [gamma proteobacterium symbiont of Ctena orbiculata]PVV15571.1 MAG: hypothetical protein B6D82_03290 [gamma proteobacterium symbiont of Ctena orbiculata]